MGMSDMAIPKRGEKLRTVKTTSLKQKIHYDKNKMDSRIQE